MGQYFVVKMRRVKTPDASQKKKNSCGHAQSMLKFAGFTFKTLSMEVHL
jgi:hypothetical protein